MAALLVSLQWRLLVNSLRGNLLKIIALVLWTAQLNGALLAIGAVLLWSSETSLRTQNVMAVAAMSAVTIAWAIVPVMFDTTHAQLMPARFASIGLNRKHLAWGLYAASLVSVVAPAFVLLVCMFATSYSQNMTGAVLAVTCAVLGFATTTLIARIVAVAMSANRRSRVAQERKNVVVVCLALLGAVAFVVAAATVTDASAFRLVQVGRFVLTVCAWSPIGAAWAAPGSWLAGNTAAAAGQLAIAVTSAGIAVWLWPLTVKHALASPKCGSGKSRHSKPKSVSFLNGGTSAVVRKMQLVLCYRDPRLRQALITIVLMCAILILLPWFPSDAGELMTNMYAVVFPIAVALIGPSLVSNVFAFTDRGLALHAVSPLNGAADVWGRVSALMLVFVPWSLIVFLCAWLAYPQMPRATLVLICGTQVMLLLGGTGIGAYCSVRLPRPMPVPKGPFGGASSTSSGSLVAGLVAVIQLAAASPVIVLGAMGHWHTWAQYACVAVATVVGATFFAVGVFAAGRHLTGHYPEVLGHLSKPT